MAWNWISFHRLPQTGEISNYLTLLEEEKWFITSNSVILHYTWGKTKNNKLWAMLSKTTAENCKMTLYPLSNTYFISFWSSLQSWDFFFPHTWSSPRQKSTCKNNENKSWPMTSLTVNGWAVVTIDHNQ